MLLVSGTETGMAAAGLNQQSTRIGEAYGTDIGYHWIRPRIGVGIQVGADLRKINMTGVRRRGRRRCLDNISFENRRHLQVIGFDLDRFGVLAFIIIDQIAAYGRDVKLPRPGIRDLLRGRCRHGLWWRRFRIGLFGRCWCLGGSCRANDRFCIGNGACFRQSLHVTLGSAGICIALDGVTLAVEELRHAFLVGLKQSRQSSPCLGLVLAFTKFACKDDIEKLFAHRAVPVLTYRATTAEFSFNYNGPAS